MTSFCRLTTNTLVSVAALWLAVSGCSTRAADAEDPYNEILHGTIAYPFAQPAAPLGISGPEEKFVIRSAVGGREYAIEIPGGARDFNVEVPLADIDAGDSLISSSSRGGPSPAVTDRELVSALPNLQETHPTDTAMLDGAFGVGPENGPTQAPSYALGISKINQHYKARQYEHALIEINHLLTFYPNSPKLLKMKGTVLVKMRNYSLAAKSWEKALDLAPEDQSLRKGLQILQRKTTGH